ncbi:MAG: GC-type dockerin domain-anchored protein [Phycisphaerales bacterium]|nr:GC-type dockerin domain-anchored protein [Phycisphaerales bacterium]
MSLMRCGLSRWALIVTVAGLCAPAPAQLYSIDNGPPHRLLRIDVQTGAVVVVGPLTPATALNGQAVQDMEFLGTRLFATFSAHPGPAQLVEIDSSSGAVLSATTLALGGAGGDPLINAVEGLAADQSGLVLAFWRPTLPNVSTSGVLGRIGAGGVVTPLVTTSSDFDGMCFDAASGVMVAVDREPGDATLELYTQSLTPPYPGQRIAIAPFTATVNGVDEPSIVGGRIVALDSVTRRVHRFDRQTGALVGSAPLNPSLSLYSSAARPCLCDLGSQGGVPQADGQLDNNDFIAFIDHFFAQDTRADLGRTGGEQGTDGQFDNNDFIVFIDLFFEGC